MRVLFTVLSVAVGIGAILFLVSLGFGLQKNLLERITTEDSLLALDISPVDTDIIRLSDENISEIKKIQGVSKISLQAVVSGQLSFNNFNSEATFNLIDPDWFSLSGMLPSIGRSPKETDTDVVVANTSVAELFNFANSKELLGENIKISLFNPTGDDFTTEPKTTGKNYEIIGILEEQDASPQIYVKFNDLPNFKVQEYQFAKVKVSSSDDLEPVRDKLISAGYLVSALSDTIDQANKIFGIIQIILGIFGVIALMVAAIGLINTMTITLLQRTNEIGIMRAIGASPRDVKTIFLGESIITGFLGGLSGILLGVITSQIVNWFLNILANKLGGQTISLFSYPFWFLLFILALSTIVGFLAGLWPASRAAKLNPLDALRYK